MFANGRAVYWLQEDVTDDDCTAPVASGSESYFLFRDHLGSVDKMRAKGVGSDLAYSFDAFGKRRNATGGWNPNDGLLDIDHTIKRGFTGHEHLDNVRLIHMNGRVQDPIMGRMISADPLLGDLRNPQSLNKYTYVNNNFVSLTDPSGFRTAPGYDFETNISVLEEAIRSYQAALGAWASCVGRTCSGAPPSVAGITSAANAMAGVNPAAALPPSGFWIPKELGVDDPMAYRMSMQYAREFAREVAYVAVTVPLNPSHV